MGVPGVRVPVPGTVLEEDVQTVGVKVGVPGVRVPVATGDPDPVWPTLGLPVTVGPTVLRVRLTLVVNVGVPGVRVAVAPPVPDAHTDTVREPVVV